MEYIQFKNYFLTLIQKIQYLMQRGSTMLDIYFVVERIFKIGINEWITKRISNLQNNNSIDNSNNNQLNDKSKNSNVKNKLNDSNDGSNSGNLQNNNLIDNSNDNQLNNKLKNSNGASNSSNEKNNSNSNNEKNKLNDQSKNKSNSSNLQNTSNNSNSGNLQNNNLIDNSNDDQLNNKLKNSNGASNSSNVKNTSNNSNSNNEKNKLNDDSNNKSNDQSKNKSNTSNAKNKLNDESNNNSIDNLNNSQLNDKLKDIFMIELKSIQFTHLIPTAAVEEMDRTQNLVARLVDCGPFELSNYCNIPLQRLVEAQKNINATPMNLETLCEKYSIDESKHLANWEKGADLHTSEMDAILTSRIKDIRRRVRDLVGRNDVRLTYEMLRRFDYLKYNLTTSTTDHLFSPSEERVLVLLAIHNNEWCEQAMNELKAAKRLGNGNAAAPEQCQFVARKKDCAFRRFMLINQEGHIDDRHYNIYGVTNQFNPKIILPTLLGMNIITDQMSAYSKGVLTPPCNLKQDIINAALLNPGGGPRAREGRVYQSGGKNRDRDRGSGGGRGRGRGSGGGRGRGRGSGGGRGRGRGSGGGGSDGSDGRGRGAIRFRGRGPGHGFGSRGRGHGSGGRRRGHGSGGSPRGINNQNNLKFIGLNLRMNNPNTNNNKNKNNNENKLPRTSTHPYGNYGPNARSSSAQRSKNTKPNLNQLSLNSPMVSGINTNLKESHNRKSRSNSNSMNSNTNANTNKRRLNLNSRVRVMHLHWNDGILQVHGVNKKRGNDEIMPVVDKVNIAEERFGKFLEILDENSVEFKSITNNKTSRFENPTMIIKNYGGRHSSSTTLASGC